MKPKKRRNSNNNEQNSEINLTQKTKKNPYKKKQNFTFNEITDKS